MKYLFDVNVLLALAHQDHTEHRKVSLWYRTARSNATEFQTCSITELGFVRISVQAGLSDTVASAQETLAALKESSQVAIALVPDPLGAATMPTHVRTPSQLTDGHLVELARLHGSKLVTLDKGIPGALLI